MLHKKNFQLNSKTHLRLQQHRKMSFHRTHVWMDTYLYQSTPDLCLGCSKYGSRFHRSHKSLAHLQSIVSRLSSQHKVSHSGKILKIHRPRKSTKTSLKVSSTKKCWEFSDHNTTSLWYTQQGRVRARTSPTFGGETRAVQYGLPTEGRDYSWTQAFAIFLPAWSTSCVHLWNQQGPTSRVKESKTRLLQAKSQLHDSFLTIYPGRTD